MRRRSAAFAEQASFFEPRIGAENVKWVLKYQIRGERLIMAVPFAFAVVVVGNVVHDRVTADIGSALVVGIMAGFLTVAIGQVRSTRSVVRYLGLPARDQWQIPRYLDHPERLEAMLAERRAGKLTR